MEEERRLFQIELRPTLQDYENFAELHARVGRGAINRMNRASNLLLHVLAVIMPLSGVLLILAERRLSSLAGLSLFISMVAILHWCFGRKLTARLMLKRNAKLSERVTAVINDDGIRVFSDLSEASYRFSAVEALYRWRESWYFYIDTVHAQMLPFRSFTKGDPAEFGGYMSEKCGLPVQTPSDQKKKKERKQ